MHRFSGVVRDWWLAITETVAFARYARRSLGWFTGLADAPGSPPRVVRPPRTPSAHKKLAANFVNKLY